ncbi:MAG: hypothetical protein KAU21_03045 [Gammaproteobacteria bacterium]|nr:hypothetical protein [Gammaproteobacteria bacterium]
MSENIKSKGIVVRDREGVLYAIPEELAQQYVIDEKDFNSAAEFYKAEEDDVSGQTMHMDDRGWGESIPDNALVNRIPRLDRY